MKKYTAVILSLLSLLLCCTGCEPNEHNRPQSIMTDSANNEYNFDLYQSIIADTVNDGYSLDMEVNFWTGTYFKKEAIASQSCIVLGKSYSAPYSKSITDKLNSYTTDIYVDENYITFGLRDDTNELVYINLMNADFFNTQPYLPDVSNPYQSAISFATKIASEYVTDISNYTQIIDEPVTQYKEKNGVTYEITYYMVTFAKRINGYYSSDYITIKVTSKGTLSSIYMGDINAFDDVMLDFDPIAMNNSIEEKVEASYKDSDLSVTQWNVVDQKIVVTPNGDICMYSTVEVEGTDISENELKTGIRILTVLGKTGK